MSTNLTNTREGPPTENEGHSDLIPSRQRRIDQQLWQEGRAYYPRASTLHAGPGYDTVEIPRFRCELCQDSGLHLGELDCPRCSPRGWPSATSASLLISSKALVGIALLIAGMGALIGALL